jgi:hypothetical protein
VVESSTDTPFRRALAEILDGAKALQGISPTNSTPEFHQFCLKLAFDTWIHVSGSRPRVDPPDGIDWAKETRAIAAERSLLLTELTHVRHDDVPAGPAHHGYGIDPHFTGEAGG